LNILSERPGRGGRHEGLVDAAAKSAARFVRSAVSRSIIRGALGSILAAAVATALRPSATTSSFRSDTPEHQVAALARFVDISPAFESPIHVLGVIAFSAMRGSRPDSRRLLGKNAGLLHQRVHSGRFELGFQDCLTCPSTAT